MISTSIEAFDYEGLRQRNKPQWIDPTKASDLVAKLNEEEKVKGKNRKTFGRTDNGTVFVVPESHDMVSQLLSPGQPKNIGDLIILAILAFHIGIFYFTSLAYRSLILGLIFAVWRASYDIGIGYLLDIQSKHRRLVTWAGRLKIFENPSTGKNPYPQLYYFLKQELETKIVKDYKFEEAPIEYNTWLVFRRVVDLVLMSDFVSYSLLAISLGLGERPVQESLWMTLTRWTGGIIMISFNIWVKVDAHRVVKDFAWYWGDFFFLVVEEPVFDGVFQMAPHPMYSIGYIGYYGIAAIAKSYPLLFVSIAAHLMQFAFLFIVEMPHMDKTYPEEPEPQEQQWPESRKTSAITTSNGGSLLRLTNRPPQIHNLTGIGSMDFCRIADVLGLLIPIYCALAVFILPSDTWTQIFFVLHAAVWRLWYAAGLGFILHCESVKKLWTRHFLKYGESNEEAWRKWKEAYYVSERMAQCTFIAAAGKMYTIPDDFSHEYALLKHVIAIALVCLQLTISASIYDALGEFGWFYGDFFFRNNVKLNYNKGPYRYLNNPEQFAGMAGLWGAVLLTESRMIFALTLLAHALAFIFCYTVERPHQKRLYKGEIRKESGIIKTLRPITPAFIDEWDIDTVLDDLVDRIELFLDSVAPEMIAKLNGVIESSTTFLHRVPMRKLDPNISDIHRKDYNLEILKTESTSDPSIIPYGTPIRIHWTAPINHSPGDWVGLYLMHHNSSRIVTNVSSQGRWIPTNLGHYESATDNAGCLKFDVPSKTNSDKVQGEMEFSSDKLWWEAGTYEFRYHHNRRHNVLAISAPFEIRIDRFTDEDSSLELDENGLFLHAAEQALLPVIQNCFERDPTIAPSSATGIFGCRVDKNGKYAKRAVYAIKLMFGLELDPEIVKLDGTVRNLAWRICTAKRVLAPHSTSSPQRILEAEHVK